MYDAIIDSIFQDDFSAFEYQYLEMSQDRQGLHNTTRFDLFMFDHSGFYNLLRLQRTKMINYLYRLNYQLNKCLVYMKFFNFKETELNQMWSYILDNGWHLTSDGTLDWFVFANLVLKHFSLLELSLRKGIHLTHIKEIDEDIFLRAMTFFYNKTPEVIRNMLDDPVWREELFPIDHDKVLCLLITDRYLQGDVITNIPIIVCRKKREIAESKKATLELSQIPRDVIEYCIHPYI